MEGSGPQRAAPGESAARFVADIPWKLEQGAHVSVRSLLHFQNGNVGARALEDTPFTCVTVGGEETAGICPPRRKSPHTPLEVRHRAVLSHASLVIPRSSAVNKSPKAKDMILSKRQCARAMQYEFRNFHYSCNRRYTRRPLNSPLTPSSSSSFWFCASSDIARKGTRRLCSSADI